VRLLADEQELRLSNSDLQSRVERVIERFFALVSARDPNVLAEFAPGDDLILVGSDDGEIARGRAQIEAFFKRLYTRDSTFSWQMQRVDAFADGDIAWFFAAGRMIVESPAGTKDLSYRISGVLQRIGHHWLWKQYHGSEPVVLD